MTGHLPVIPFRTVLDAHGISPGAAKVILTGEPGSDVSGRLNARGLGRDLEELHRLACLADQPDLAGPDPAIGPTWWTVAQAAEVLRYSPRRVRELLTAGRLQGHPPTGARRGWLVDPDSARRHLSWQRRQDRR